MRIATFFLFLGLFLQVQAQMKQPDLKKVGTYKASM